MEILGIVYVTGFLLVFVGLYLASRKEVEYTIREWLTLLSVSSGWFVSIPLFILVFTIAQFIKN